MGPSHSFFTEQRRARLSLPPNPPISLPHVILPYKLTHSSSHPLQGQPNGPSKMHMKCRGLPGTPRVGEIYLPIPHPGDMCSGENQQHVHKSVTEGLKKTYYTRRKYILGSMNTSERCN